MEEPNQTSTLSKLVSREKFYKEKALRMEKELVFAKEQIAAMEARILDLDQKDEEGEQEKQRSLEKLQQKLDQLKAELEEKERTHEKRVSELLNEIETLKTNQSKGKITPQTNYEEKMEGYERLLSEVQTTINQKDKEVLVLRKRLETLEKRLKNRDYQMKSDPTQYFVSEDDSHTSRQKAISYIDHAVILNEKSCVIRGNCVIENLGGQMLDTPVICFRINPIDAVKLKGKIQSPDSGEEMLLSEDDWQWSYVQNNWSEEAKERGEIWIAPTRPIKIEPYEQVKLEDLQFVVDKMFCKQLIIECFIYFEASGVRLKTVNPIILNF